MTLPIDYSGITKLTALQQSRALDRFRIRPPDLLNFSTPFLAIARVEKRWMKASRARLLGLRRSRHGPLDQKVLFVQNVGSRADRGSTSCEQTAHGPLHIPPDRARTSRHQGRGYVQPQVQVAAGNASAETLFTCNSSASVDAPLLPLVSHRKGRCCIASRPRKATRGASSLDWSAS